MRTFLLLSSLFASFAFAELTVDFFSDANCQNYVESVHPIGVYNEIHAPEGVLSALWVDHDGVLGWFGVVREPGVLDPTDYWNPGPTDCMSRTPEGDLAVLAG
ncbi:hypothetical protein F5884DRAFT_430086 [Xylogone sp. PMI_703]|nr:hypothetical protein F5884DRAFT_430086 [Xylogone sp. PMI_703]